MWPFAISLAICAFCATAVCSLQQESKYNQHAHHKLLEDLHGKGHERFCALSHPDMAEEILNHPFLVNPQTYQTKTSQGRGLSSFVPIKEAHENGDTAPIRITVTYEALNGHDEGQCMEGKATSRWY